MAAHALTSPGEPVGMRLARNVDLALLVVALAIFLAAALPIAGWLAGAGGWLLQRAIRELLARRAARATDPRTIVGLITGSMILRGWLVAGILFAVGLSDRVAGLSAAVLVLALFTLHFSMALALRPVERTTAPPRTSRPHGQPRPPRPPVEEDL